MPRARAPLERAEITGATVIHPGRFAGRSDPKTIRIGNAPPGLDATQVAAWEAFRAEVPWLMESDRALLEVASKLRARLWTDPDMSIAAMNQLRMCCGLMGATPADRSKVMVPDELEKDAADRFFN